MEKKTDNINKRYEMISQDLFDTSEPKMLHLVNLWNVAESNPAIYDTLFISNPHELTTIIGQGTNYGDWQMFLTDSRVQDYIDKIIYTQAGLLINRYMVDGVHLSQADSARLNTAIKYRDDHKPDFAIPVQYIYNQVPLTAEEKEFVNDNKVVL